jgi:hypothetical protein
MDFNDPAVSDSGGFRQGFSLRRVAAIEPHEIESAASVYAGERPPRELGAILGAEGEADPAGNPRLPIRLSSF